MENNKSNYEIFKQERLQEKVFAQIDQLKVLETFQRSVNLFNSFGLKDKAPPVEPTNTKVKALGERN
jgi:hypothetical protein